jgi:formylglycine-generating enzyme required for sulfatase activity
MTHKFDFALALLVITAIGLIDIFVTKESRRDPERMVWIDAGFHPTASSTDVLNERLSASVELYGFWIDQDEVSRGDYQQFIADAGHVIFAGQTVAAGVFKPGDRLTQVRLAEDRAWRHLQGTDADAQTRQKVYVTYGDAQAYCNWLNKDLPTEAQFGFAARGDGADKVYNWSSGRKHLTGFRCVTNPTALQRIFE